MKVLAIDPGYGRIGFAVLTKENLNISVLFSQCVETEKKTAFADRLAHIGNRMKEIIHNHKPGCVAIEQLFFAKNKKTALQTAEVRGLCIYTARSHGLEIAEYTPNQVKNAITGNSNATKKDIIRMIPHLTPMQQKKEHDDEYDAIAIGITHLSSSAVKITTQG